jgi:hypothetical protein
MMNGKLPVLTRKNLAVTTSPHVLMAARRHFWTLYAPT